MAYLISVADVWHALNKTGNVAAATELATKAQDLLTTYTALLADSVGIEAGRASMDYQEFGGLLIPVYARTEGQPVPACLAGADTADEFDTRANCAA